MRCWSHPTKLGIAIPQDGTKMCFGVLTRTTPVSEMELGLSPEDGRHWEVSPACSCVPCLLMCPCHPQWPYKPTGASPDLHHHGRMYLCAG